MGEYLGIDCRGSVLINPIPLPASPLKGEEKMSVAFTRLPW